MTTRDFGWTVGVVQKKTGEVCLIGETFRMRRAECIAGYLSMIYFPATSKFYLNEGGTGLNHVGRKRWAGLRREGHRCLRSVVYAA